MADAWESSGGVVGGRVLFGVGRVAEVGDEVRKLGVERVAVVGGGRADGVVRGLGELVGVRVGGVRHVPVDLVGEVVRSVVDGGVGAVVAVGGGAAIGLAKAVALRTGVPVVAVPTTYSGSEMSPIWGQTDGGVKTTGRDPRVLPAVVIYDPELTAGMPAVLAACSGMNAMAHAVEALYAPDVTPLVASAAVEAIRLLAGALPGSGAGARWDAMTGAYLAGVALGNATMGLHHRLCHLVAGALDLPHAETHAVLLPYVCAVNRSRLGRVAEVLGVDDAAVGLWRLGRSLGVPRDLAALGVTESFVDGVGAIDVANPVAVTGELVRGVLRAALAGREPDVW